jgi:phosphoglycolate phosphatase
MSMRCSPSSSSITTQTSRVRAAPSLAQRLRSNGSPAQGATLAVCTNKREYLSRLLLRELDLEHYFSAIAGRETFAVSKPDPGHLTGAIALAAGNPSRALMVGDSDVDVKTAKAAGVPVIVVSFGYAATPPVILEAEAMIDHFDQLEVCAATLLAAKRRCRAQS